MGYTTEELSACHDGDISRGVTHGDNSSAGLRFWRLQTPVRNVAAQDQASVRSYLIGNSIQKVKYNLFERKASIPEAGVKTPETGF
jgi:hypothetical protein